MKVSVRHKEGGRQKDNFYQRHCYGCCANASICHCLVLTVVPTTGFTAAASQIYNVRRGTKKKKWWTFVKYSFHKAAIVERRQDQNYNVEPGHCLPTGQQVSCSCTVHHRHADCTVFVCTCARVHIKAFCVYPLYPWVQSNSTFPIKYISGMTFLYEKYFWIHYTVIVQNGSR